MGVSDRTTDPRIDAAFPRMMAIDIRCHSHAVSLRSPVDCDIRLPSTLKNLEAAGPTTPDVSTASGTKRYCSAREEYRCILRFSAARAADPGSRAHATTADSEKVSVHVESHAKHFPLANGKVVRPSGRFPSPLSRPTGSSKDGTPATERLRFTRSLRWA